MPKQRNTDYGVKEKQCSKCQEWWPATKEFFYYNGHSPRKLHSWCKACVLERKRERREARKVEVAKAYA